MIEASEMIPPVLGFGFDIRYLEALRNSLAQYLPATLGGEAPNVGDDVATCLDGGQHIGMNGP